MPNNDVLRFILILLGMIFLFAIFARIVDGWIAYKKLKYRDEELFDEMKEALNDDEDDSQSR